MCEHQLTIVCFAIGFIIHIILLLINSTKLYSAIQTPSQYSYTTCIITDIKEYKHNKIMMKDISFIYGDNWDQTATFGSKSKNWNDDNKPGDIGTCCYASNKENDAFTIKNYVENTNTSAMWLIVDEKRRKLLWIIYSVFALIYYIFELSKKPTEPLEALMPPFLAGFMTGIPMIVIGSIIAHAALNNGLRDDISVNDAYINISNCRIESILDDNEFNWMKYNVSNNGSFVAIDNNEWNVGMTHNCYQNIYTKQVVLSNYPNVTWLQPPSTGGFVLIVVGIFISAPLVFSFVEKALSFKKSKYEFKHTKTNIEMGQNHEGDEDNTMNVCNTCGITRNGKFDENNGLFYCSVCWDETY